MDEFNDMATPGYLDATLDERAPSGFVETLCAQTELFAFLFLAQSTMPLRCNESEGQGGCKGED